MLADVLARVVTRPRPATRTAPRPPTTGARAASVHPMAERDLPQVARLHEVSLQHGFFVDLGARFLTSYHRSFLSSPLAVAVVASEDDDVLGFVVGPLRSAEHYRWVVRHHGARLALGALVGVLARPRLWGTFVRTRLGHYARGVWETLLSRRGRRAGVPGDEGERRSAPAVLTHVAIREDARGRGLGALLVGAFEDACRAADASEIRLVTEAEGGAADYYREHGWRQADERTGRDGERMLEFRRDLTASR
jgi:GNAT superfamily N-acetyltransferase